MRIEWSFGYEDAICSIRLARLEVVLSKICARGALSIICYIEDCQCQFDVHLIHFHPSQNKRIKISTRGTLSRGGPCISSYTGSHIWSCNVSC